MFNVRTLSDNEFNDISSSCKFILKSINILEWLTSSNSLCSQLVCLFIINISVQICDSYVISFSDKFRRSNHWFRTFKQLVNMFSNNVINFY
jgi:hypothetical protein